MKARSIAPALLAFALAVPSLSLAADAASNFKTRCTPCHGSDGSGNTPMGKKVGAKALASPEVQKLSDADLQKAITAGKGKMPEFGSKLSAEQIGDLVKFVRSFGK